MNWNVFLMFLDMNKQEIAQQIGISFGTRQLIMCFVLQ